MDRVRSISLSSIVIKFTGPLSLWDSQTSFDANFGFDLTMFCLTSLTKDQCAIEDTKYLASKILAFYNLSRYVCDSNQLQYIDTNTLDSYIMLVHISLVLSKLKMMYTLHEKEICFYTRQLIL